MSTVHSLTGQAAMSHLFKTVVDLQVDWLAALSSGAGIVVSGGAAALVINGKLAAWCGSGSPEEQAAVLDYLQESGAAACTDCGKLRRELRDMADRMSSLKGQVASYKAEWGNANYRNDQMANELNTPVFRSVRDQQMAIRNARMECSEEVDKQRELVKKLKGIADRENERKDNALKDIKTLRARHTVQREELDALKAQYKEQNDAINHLQAAGRIIPLRGDAGELAALLGKDSLNLAEVSRAVWLAGKEERDKAQSDGCKCGGTCGGGEKLQEVTDRAYRLAISLNKSSAACDTMDNARAKAQSLAESHSALIKRQGVRVAHLEHANKERRAELTILEKAAAADGVVLRLRAKKIDELAETRKHLTGELVHVREDLQKSVRREAAKRAPDTVEELADHLGGLQLDALCSLTINEEIEKSPAISAALSLVAAAAAMVRGVILSNEQTGEEA